MSQTTAATRSPYPAWTGAAQRRIKAKTVGSFVPGLTKKACEKYGFSAASLISDWAQIVGPDLCRHTAPQRLKWPRHVPAYKDVEAGCEGRPGATLTLHVDPAKALDIQYGSAQLIERINGYFGYRAVSDIRIVQVPIKLEAQTGDASVPSLSRSPSAPPERPKQAIELPAIKDDRLRAALERLAQSVK